MAIDEAKLSGLVGHDVVGHDGSEVGKLLQVVGDQTGQPVWLVISQGVASTREVLAPASGAELRHSVLHVAWTAEHVHAGPDTADRSHMTGEEQRALEEHFGIVERPH